MSIDGKRLVEVCSVYTPTSRIYRAVVIWKARTATIQSSRSSTTSTLDWNHEYVTQSIVSGQSVCELWNVRYYYSWSVGHLGHIHTYTVPLERFTIAVIVVVVRRNAWIVQIPPTISGIERSSSRWIRLTAFSYFRVAENCMATTVSLSSQPSSVSHLLMKLPILCET